TGWYEGLPLATPHRARRYEPPLFRVARDAAYPLRNDIPHASVGVEDHRGATEEWKGHAVLCLCDPPLNHFRDEIEQDLTLRADAACGANRLNGRRIDDDVSFPRFLR